MILDVGATSVASGYLERAANCASEIVQRKLFAEAEDKYALILVGTRRNSNNLNYPHISVVETTEGVMAKSSFVLLEYIEKNLMQMAGPEVGNADWMDAIIVAMDILHVCTEGSKVRNKRIIALTDMGSPASDDKLEMVIDAIKRDQIEFTFLLPEWAEEGESTAGDTVPGYNGKQESGENNLGQNNHNGKGEPSKGGCSRGTPQKNEHLIQKPKSAVQEEGLILMESISAASPDAESCGIQMAQEYLFTKERKKKKSMAWKVDLEIGSDIRIPVAGYVAIRRENAKTWKRCLARPNGSIKSEGMFDEIKAETTFVRNNEDQEVIETDNLIDAFKYGTKVCPISELEQSAAKYEGGPKSLILIGFVKRAEVPVTLMLGEGCMVFQYQMDSEYSKTALSSLIEAMVREEMVAIVRRVYSKNSAPKLGALIPEDSIDTDGQETRRLVYIELPFAEDLRNYQFPPLWSCNADNKGDGESSKNNPSKVQLKAVDKLIDSMMLNNQEENDQDENDIKTDMLLNPYHQHLYKCLTSRALNPTKGRSVPSVDLRIQEIMEPPKTLANNSNKTLNDLGKLFKLETIIKKKEKQTGDTAFGNMDKRPVEPLGKRDVTSNCEEEERNKRLKLNENSIDLALNSDSLVGKVTEVGTTTPVNDFEKLLQGGFHINTVSIQMENVILVLLKTSFGDQMTEKIISCLVSYRQACIELNSPTVYNKFIRLLKTVLLDSSNKREKIWQRIIHLKIGLIDRNICDAAQDVSAEESKAFLSTNTSNIPTNNERDEIEREDAEDLLDDL